MSKPRSTRASSRPATRPAVRPSVRALSIPLNAASAETELSSSQWAATTASPAESSASSSAERPPLLRLVGDDAATASGVEAMNDDESAAFRGINRRKHHRFALVRSSKVFRRASASFVPARTVNLSVGGALIEAAAARPFEVGEIIDLGVAYRGAAAVAQDAMQQAIVVRVQTLDEQRQTVAVRYVNPHHLERRVA